MAILHTIRYALEDEEEENNKPDEVSPYVDCLVVQRKESFCYFLWRFVVYSIPASYVLIVFDVTWCLFIATQVRLRSKQSILRTRILRSWRVSIYRFM